jgi:hypothetical protein
LLRVLRMPGLRTLLPVALAGKPTTLIRQSAEVNSRVG